MSDDDETGNEIKRQACFDAGLVVSIGAVLFIYVLFFAFVFTEPPKLPSHLPLKPVNPAR
jgi:hypothetical protein